MEVHFLTFGLMAPNLLYAIVIEHLHEGKKYISLIEYKNPVLQSFQKMPGTLESASQVKILTGSFRRQFQY